MWNNKWMAWHHAMLTLVWLWLFFVKFPSILTVFFIIVSAILASEHVQRYLKEKNDE